MDLQQLKSSVNIIDIAHELGLQLDRNKKCLCPFHKEKTASLQFSEEKQIATCFSANCDAGTMDVIDLVKKFYSWELPKAIEWLKSHANIIETPKASIQPKTINYPEIFNTLSQKLKRSTKVKGYLEYRHLDHNKMEAGYNPGKDFEKLKYCVVFPLKNKKDEIVSFYGRSILPQAKAKHFYTTNRKGLYPCYPNPQTRQLILTECIIDAETLKQHFIFSQKRASVLALYGTNGLTPEHTAAIKELKNLQEITLWMDGDQAGKAASKKYASELQQLLPSVKISTVDMLEGEDINSLLESHEPNIYKHLFEKRKAYNPINGAAVMKELPTKALSKQPKLEIKTNYAIYETDQIKIELMGKIDLKDFSKLRVTIIIQNTAIKEYSPSRNNVDLYNDERVEKLIRRVCEKIQLGRSIVMKSLDKVTKDLEEYRLKHQDNIPDKKVRYPLRDIPQSARQKALEILQDPNLSDILRKKLHQTGVIGEELNAMFLLIILMSRKTHRPLNAMVQGTSGSGKSHLIKKVADCMYNQNKVKRFTRVTDKSFYNYGERDLCNCAIILEDYDGLGEEAELAWRELQSNDMLSSSVSVKNEQTGDISTGEKYVYGPIASVVATTNFRIYEDNETRVFVIAIDESETQTEKVLEYMAKKASKEITSEVEQLIREQIQDMVYMLKPYRVRNPYRLSLPKTTHHRRRLTQMLHDFIEQVTILYQHQRQKEDGLLVTELQDVELAVKLMFNSIVLKTDELDGILRQFYEDLKVYIEKRGKEYEFTQREIRQYFRVSKTQMFRYIKELEELEYIQRSSIGARNIHRYKISYWDNIEKLRQELKQHLYVQIDHYKGNP